MIKKIFYFSFIVAQLASFSIASDMKNSSVSVYNHKFNVRLYPSSAILNPLNTSYGVEMTRHEWIQDDFQDYIYSSETGNNFAEVGGGTGIFMESVFKDARNQDKAITYTFVEKIDSQIDIATQRYQKFSKENKENALLIPRKERRDALVFFDNKKDAYDGVGIFQVMHYFSPVEQVTFLRDLYNSIKPGGKAFFIMNGIPSVMVWFSLFQDSTALGKEFLDSVFSAPESIWKGYYPSNGSLDIGAQMAIKNPNSIFIPTLHSTDTFTSLLHEMDFNVDVCSYFCGKENNSQEITTPRIGCIVTKPRTDSINREEKFQQLLEKAQAVVDKKKKELNQKKYGYGLINEVKEILSTQRLSAINFDSIIEQIAFSMQQKYPELPQTQNIESITQELKALLQKHI